MQKPQTANYPKGYYECMGSHTGIRRASGKVDKDATAQTYRHYLLDARFGVLLEGSFMNRQHRGRSVVNRITSCAWHGQAAPGVQPLAKQKPPRLRRCLCPPRLHRRQRLVVRTGNIGTSSRSAQRLATSTARKSAPSCSSPPIASTRPPSPMQQRPRAGRNARPTTMRSSASHPVTPRLTRW